MTLFSYCLRYDDGAAPNPFWEVCTLSICKPKIRRTAQEGDWVVGLGSKNSPIGDISTQVVYAMKVTRILPIREYDELCRASLGEKIPDWTNSDFRRQMGDCIYDYSGGDEPRLRRSVHKVENRKTDLSGQNVLLSDHFYYFGDKPEALPPGLLAIVHPTQGHKSNANEPYVTEFVNWIESRDIEKNKVLGHPQLKDKFFSASEEDCRSSCSQQHREEDENDENC
jgi:putative DNA base modification enzyme with NMAD domain